MIIAIIGPMHVGKTELATGLEDNLAYTDRAPLADQLREVMNGLCIPLTRRNMQMMGHGMREIKEDVWVEAWVRKYQGSVNRGHNKVIDDVRYQNEIELANVYIRLTCDEDTQWERYQTSNKYVKDFTREQWSRGLNHETETQVLTSPSDVTLKLDTTELSSDDVLSKALTWLSPRWVGLN